MYIWTSPYLNTVLLHHRLFNLPRGPLNHWHSASSYAIAQRQPVPVGTLFQVAIICPIVTDPKVGEGEVNMLGALPGYE